MSDHTPSQEQTQEIPYGYCHCGCGQKTNIATRTRTEAGWIRGQPLRYISGHNARLFPPIEEPNPSGLCMCGCGQLAPIAAKDRRDIGHVKGRPVKYILGHYLVQGRTSLEDCLRFYCPKGAPDECWEWQGHKNRDGYGAICHESKRYLAHRVAYELHYGPIPEGEEVCHSCDNPACCNWAHLFAGVHAVNAADMVSKNRQARGERVGNAKLTNADVVEIRRLCRSGISQAAVARQFNISDSTVSQIVLFKRWIHVVEET